MTHQNLAALALVLGLLSRPSHAFLDHAVPGVGSTVSAAPAELQLSFTQDVEAALSGVRVNTATGAAVAAAKPTSEGGSTLHVRLSRALSGHLRRAMARGLGRYASNVGHLQVHGLALKRVLRPGSRGGARPGRATTEP